MKKILSIVLLLISFPIFAFPGGGPAGHTTKRETGFRSSTVTVHYLDGNTKKIYVDSSYLIEMRNFFFDDNYISIVNPNGTEIRIYQQAVGPQEFQRAFDLFDRGIGG